MIKTLIVNDTLVAQQVLKRIVNSDPELELAGIANDGDQGIRMVNSVRPHIVLMDISMPNVNGIQAVREIMKQNPCPILVVTGTVRANMDAIYECLDYGALDVIKTPGSSQNGQLEASALLKKIHTLSDLQAQMNRNDMHTLKTIRTLRKDSNKTRISVSSRKVVAIGASTGGPHALHTILKALPADLHASVMVVQHIDCDFAQGLADWFDSDSELCVLAAKEGEHIKNGTVYIASEHQHLTLGAGMTIFYQDASPNDIHVPSVDVLFESVADQYGRNAVGILLTGMGNDGARGLKAIRDSGGHTIAQDEDSSLIYGMPKAAVENNAAEFILPLHKIPTKVLELLNDE